MQYGLTGKVAVVTAASKGLGRASALLLAKEGCDLAICSRDAAEIEAVAAEIRAETGRRVLAIGADVTKQADVERFMQVVMEAYGGVDILISNTGGPPTGQFMDFDDAAWQTAFEALLLPAVRLSRAVIPSMKARGGGRIVYITSGAVKQPVPGLMLSNSLRAAVHGMAKTLAAEVAASSITVNCVAPGRIDTDRVRFLDDQLAAKTGQESAAVKAAREATIPVGRYGEPQEFGQAVAFLCSAGAAYITGTTLWVDGGLLNTLL